MPFICYVKDVSAFLNTQRHNHSIKIMINEGFYNFCLSQTYVDLLTSYFNYISVRKV